jgi:hypothetical protein
MEKRNKKKILVGVLLILILMNIAALLTFGYHKFMVAKNEKEWGDKKKEFSNQNERVKQFVKNELQMDDNQFADYCKLKDLNVENTNEIWERLGNLRKATQIEITGTNPDTLKLALLSDSIGMYHKKMQMEMNRHFLATKKILNPDQIAKFNEMIINTDRRHWRGPNNYKKRDTCNSQSDKKHFKK